MGDNVVVLFVPLAAIIAILIMVITYLKKAG